MSLIDMRGIVKRFNEGTDAEITVLPGCDFQMEPGEFVHTLGDAHLYLNHLEQTDLQLTRTPGPLPRMEIAPRDSIDAYELEDFTLVGYEAAPSIKAPIAV